MIYEQGDIIKTDLSPVKGHEQSGYRPLLVVSNNDFNHYTNLTKVVPITTHGEKFPLHIELPANLITNGQILTEQERTLDTHARDTHFVEKCPQNILDEVLKMISETY